MVKHPPQKGHPKTPAKSTGSTSSRSPQAPIKKKSATKIITDTVEGRLTACILMKAGWDMKKACKEAKINRSNFCRAKWFQKFTEGGMDALLVDERHNTPKQITPNTKERLRKSAEEGKNAPEAPHKAVPCLFPRSEWPH